MCTYHTVSVEVTASAKGAAGWFRASQCSVYYDHPVHARRDHTLNIDVINPSLGPSARVALELDPTSARELAAAIFEALASVPEELLV
jgi:hypothetical protein